MTEAEWMTCGEPAMLFEAIKDRASSRKLRLLACACCRRIAPHLNLSASLRALETAERLADGRASEKEVTRAAQEPFDYYSAGSADGTRNLDLAAGWACMTSGDGYPIRYAAIVFENACRLGAPWVHGEPLTAPQQSERAEQASLLRDIFGDPFRPVTFNPSWRTDTALSLAQGMYESRDFSAMPILADALQDAGCGSAEVLDHCRESGPHVRGCWVVDLVLGKE